MITADLRLIETFDGGDYVLKGNDLEMISGFQNMPYIGLFGGNEQSTKGQKKEEQVFDFWGNYLFHPNEPKIWINSITETLLQNVALTTTGRVKIEEAVKADVAFMKDFAVVSVSVQLISVDRIKILIEIQEPSIENSTIFTYIWNATQQELIDQSIGNQSGQGIALDAPLNFGL